MATEHHQYGRRIDRRHFLSVSAAILGGAVALDACGSSGTPSSSGATSHPPISKEPGNLSILEWGGYEAAGGILQKILRAF